MKLLKTLSAAIMFLVAENAWAGYTHVNITMTDGTKQEIVLSETLTHTFTTTHMVVSDGNEVTVEIPRKQIKLINFTSTGSTGIVDKFTNNETSVEYGHGYIFFSNLPSNTNIKVYSINGQLLLSKIVNKYYTLNFNTVPKGINIVNINGVSYKIAVK